MENFREGQVRIIHNEKHANKGNDGVMARLT